MFVCLFFFSVGASLCRLLSDIFSVRACFGMDPATSFLECACHYPLDGECEWWYTVQSLCWMWGGASSLLQEPCHCPVRGRVSSPDVGVEALRVGFDQALLPLSACLAPKLVFTKASEAHVVTVNLCITCVGVCSSSQKQPKVASLSPSCSAET